MISEFSSSTLELLTKPAEEVGKISVFVDGPDESDYF